MLCIYYFLMKRRKLLGQPNILASTNQLMYYFLYDIHTLCLSLGCNNRNPIRVLCHLFQFLDLTIRVKNVTCKYKNKIVCIFGMNSINIPHISCNALYMYISLNRWTQPPYISDNHILGPTYRDRLRVALTKTVRRMKKHAEQEGWGEIERKTIETSGIPFAFIPLCHRRILWQSSFSRVLPAAPFHPLVSFFSFSIPPLIFACSSSTFLR